LSLAPQLVSAIPTGYYPEFVLRITFTHAMDLDHENLENPASYGVTQDDSEAGYFVLPRAVESVDETEEYGYGYQYAYEDEPYDPDGAYFYAGDYEYYSQQTPTAVDVYFYGEPQGSYTLRILRPLLAANGEWLMYGCTEWDDLDTIWDGGDTGWDCPDA